MQAALVTGYTGVFGLAEVDIDQPTGDEVRVEVRASGLCHSDLINATTDRGLRLPLLCGHEVAGVVAAIGPAVRNVEVGDHVTTCVAGACEHCAKCQSGRPWLCEGRAALQRPARGRPRLRVGDQPVTTLAAIGGFAEQVLAPERSLVAIDKRVPFDAACVLGCAVVTGIGAAVNSARIEPGDTVAVIGCGGVGLNVIQGARLRGASRIVAVDLSSGRLARAVEFGASDTVNSLQGSALEQVNDLVAGGVDHAFEAVGRADTVNQAIHMLARGGTAYLIGASGEPVYLSGVTAADLSLGGRSVLGIYAGSTRFKHDIPRYVELYRRGLIQLDALISERISLDKITAAYQQHDNGEAARTVVVF